jgi:hypothetical protein
VPELILKSTGQRVPVAPGNVQRALDTGLYEAPEGTTVQVSSPAGLLDVPAEQAGGYQQSFGDPTATVAETGALEREGYLENKHGGFFGAAATFANQALNEGSFGLYGGLHSPEGRQDMAEQAELHDTAATAGSIFGIALPAVVSGGGSALAKGAVAAALPGASVASKIGASIVGKAAGKGLVARTAAGVAGGIAEGSLFGAGHVVAESVLHDKELTGEAVVAGLKEGALWGGAAGGGATLVSAGTAAATKKVQGWFDKPAQMAEAKALAKADAKAQAAAASEAKQARARADRMRSSLIVEEQRQANRIALAEKRGATAKEIESIRAETRQKIAELGSETQLEKVAKQAELKLDLARQKAAQSSERLAAEELKLERARVLSDAKVKTAETYAGGWRDVNESKVLQRQIGKEAAGVTADARLRTGLADARVRAVTDDAARYVDDITPEGMLAKRADEVADDAMARARPDAGMPLKDMVPARARTPKAVAAARANVATEAMRLSAGTDDLVRQVDDVIAVNPMAAEELAGFRNAAAESAAQISAWSQKAANGTDAFEEGFTTIRRAEQAQHDLAQAMRMHAEAAGIPTPQLNAVTAGMDEAVAKVDDITADAMAKNVKAAAETTGGGFSIDAQKVAGLDILLQLGGMPNAEDIPVIGPVLSAYLKFRAATGGGHVRFPGSVGRIAAISAGVQNRASDVVKALVSRAPAAANVAAKAAPSLSATLSRPLWEPLEGEKDKKADAPRYDPDKLYRKRIEELDRALGDPETTRQRMVDNAYLPPTLANAVADVEMRKLESLNGVVSVDPRAPTVRPSAVRANAVEIKRFTEHKYALENPVEAIKHVLDGVMGPHAADAVKEVFPRLFQSMQEELVELLAESDEPIGFDRLVRAALVFDIPLDHQTRPEYVAARQTEYDEAKAAAQPPTPSGGQLRLSPQEELGSMRRAMR